MGQGSRSSQAPLDAVQYIDTQIDKELQDTAHIAKAVGELTVPSYLFDDGYPDWHPWPYSFEGIIRAFLFMRVTGRNYEDMHRDLRQRPILAHYFGLEQPPDRSVYSRAWRKRFNDDLRQFVEQAAEAILAAAHNARVPTKRLQQFSKDEDDTSELDEHQIKRTTRLGRRYAFKSFQSDRAANAKYPDECFYELQSYMSMTSCGTPQGARRFAHTSTREETPHGDTHLRTIKKFDEGQILGNFHRAAERTVNALKQTSALREPVTVAIDITEEPYWGEGMRRTSGSGKGDSVAYTTAHKYATLTVVGKNALLYWV